MADQAPEVVIVDPSGTEHHFPAGFDPQKAAAIVRAATPNQVTAKPEDFTDKAPPQTFGRFVGSAIKSVLPSTTLSDYIEGPVYAAAHPIDSAKLIGSTIYQGSADQASKAKESAGRVFTSPTVGGKVAAASETVGHVGGMVPIVGTPAAQTGEQIASGDVAGGLGSGVGLLAPSALVAGYEAARVKGWPTSAAVKADNATRAAAVGTPSAGNVDRMNQALAATTKENKTRSARIAPEMVKRGIWNADLPKLEARAAAESNTAGQAVGAEVAKVADKEVDVAPLVAELEKAKAQFIDTPSPGSSAHGGVPPQIVQDPAPVAAIQKIQDTLNQYGDKVSIASVNKLRQNLDTTVQAGKGFTTPDLGTHWTTWAAREGRSALRDEIGKASADMNKVMAEYAFWQNIEDVAHATNQRRVGQNGSLLPTIAAQGGAMAADAVTGGHGLFTKAVGVVTGAKAGAMLKRLVDSPGWKMFTAVQRQRIADAFAAGNTGVIEDAFRAANGTRRLVGRTPEPQGRLSIVGVSPNGSGQQAGR